ncbi:Ig-like domain-containing protein [Pseudoalteromonas sp. MMG006]|uniref:Ig-like domain-containing protein n=1 Tax=Pseudoalteromonas sp. MMG006 TaxID=2822683 RepID=UPI001B39B132|nr:Ig-like domain-containing protein [Pseudoalteromonas sp. MMG006]MBQ4798988.1 Ig-like domain-containing protein [Pseudoalteromonas sp. MMG006]
MPLMRLLGILLLSFLLTACGGGGSLEKGSGTLDGDTGEAADEAIVQSANIEITFEDRIVTADSPLEITAIVLDSDGLPVQRQEISFTTTLGSFIPATGSALTDTNGIATIELEAGSIEGAGTIVASYEDISSKLGFYTAGDEPQSDDSAANIDIKILQNCPDSWLNIDRDSFELDPSSCSQNSNLLGQQAIVYAKITQPGSNTPASNVLVQATTTLGILLPESLTAKTDEFGVAILNLLPGSSSGVGQVELTAQGGVASALFEINAVQVNVNLSASIATSDVLSAGSTTIVTAQIVDGSNNAFTTPLEVQFTSACAEESTPRATIDNIVTSIGGTASATYKANGCNGIDTITATVVTGGNVATKTININVAAAETGSIAFMGVTNQVLAIKGTGGQNLTENSELTFKLLDVNGNPVGQEQIDFSLSQNPGGALLDSVFQFTNNEGLVTVNVRSGKAAGILSVIASHQIDSSDTSQNSVISIVSNDITITTGVPDQDSFTLAVQTFNTESLNEAGVTTDLTVFAADHFNNFVPDNTAIYIASEGGAVGTIDEQQFTPLLLCRTIDGVCKAQWRSQNPIPYHYSIYNNSVADKCDRYFGQPAPCTLGIRESQLDVDGNLISYLDSKGVPIALADAPNDAPIDYPLGGRVSLLAYSVGEESFNDVSANGEFNQNEFDSTLQDLPEAFIDFNENGVFDGNLPAPTNPVDSNGGEDEWYVERTGAQDNGLYDSADGKYNGLLCSDEALAANACTRETVNVRASSELIMSGSTPYVRAVTALNDCSLNDGIRLETSDMAGMCDINLIDISNSTPYSAISITIFFSDIHNNPLPAGTTVAVTSDNAVLKGLTNYTVINTAQKVPNSVTVNITKEAEPDDVDSGFLYIEFETPGGVKTQYSVMSILDEPKS